MAAATAGLYCCCLGSPCPRTSESLAARLASTPRGGAAFTAVIFASSPWWRRGFHEEQRFPPRWALSNVGPNGMVAEVHEQQQKERILFPRLPVIRWEKDFANAVQLIGRVGRDIESKYLNSGKIVATTSLAVHEESQGTDYPSWFTLEIWNDLAEIAAHHVSKGDLIRVAGKIVVDIRVEDDVRYTNVKVVVRDFCFVEPSSDRRPSYGNSNDEFTVKGSSSQTQAAVASMNFSQRNWNQRQLSSQPSQGAFAGFQGNHGNSVAQLEVLSPQTRAEIIEHIHSAGSTSQAIAVLQNRLQRGLRPDCKSYVKVLQMCFKQNDLFAAKQVHDCIIQSGMDKNLYLAGNLLNVYIKCGALVDARRVFDQLKKKSVIDWTVMIAGYAKSEHSESALELFNQMRQDGVQPDEISYLSILKACTSLVALKWGKEIHECIRQAGFESDVRVGTALLQMYVKCGCIAEARRVFEKLTSRDVITWTIMIDGLVHHGCGQEAYGLFLQMRQGGFEPNAFTWNVIIGGLAQHGCGHEAYRLFLQMRQEGIEPDTYTYASILNASASEGALEWVKEVHGHARKVGLESDLRVGTALVHMYAESGSIDDARRVFDRMVKRNVVTWNVMIGGLAQHGCGHEAYRLFCEMRQRGFEPDAFTFANILNASASEGALEWVKEVHGQARKVGLESDLHVGTALVHMYAETGSVDDARRVFDRMDKRNVVTWNVFIGGLAQHGCGHEAYRLFCEMRQEGFEPNEITYVSILNASASAGALEWVKEVHGHASKAGLDSDFRVGTALVHMYAESGSIDDARRVFDKTEKRNVFTWNVMIGGLAQHGCGHEALALFEKMNADLVKPNGTTIVAVLSACCHAGLVDDGRRLFSAIKQDYGIEPDIFHYTCMVDLLGRAGHLEEAKRLISDMPVEPDVVIWTALLGACRTYDNVELGELAAKELFKLEPSKASTYVLLSNIYAAAGKWEQVSLVRTMMQKRGVRKEPGRSWIEVDNKIHEFVVGDKSHPEAKAIYTELTKLTEKLKAEGYIPDTQLVLHDINEEDKELALCSHSEKLAIAYGLIHIPEGEPIRVEKNLRVCSDCHTATKLISKVTGREIIARDLNRFHHFKDGVCSCGDYW